MKAFFVSPGRGKAQGLLGSFQWLVPGAVLMLMPKCPVCLAACLAIGTGIGVSVSTAANIQTLLVLFCTGSLALMTVKGGCRLIRRFTMVPEKIITGPDKPILQPADTKN